MAVAMQTEDFPYLPSGLAEVNQMIKEHGDLFSDAQCKVCSAVLISESQKLTHYQSKKHANKVRRYLSLQNEKEPMVKKFKSPSADNDCNNGDSEREKACHLCNMTFSSPVMAESHYQGRVHAKNLRLKTVGLPNTSVVTQSAPPAPVKKPPPSDECVDAAGGAGGGSNPERFCSTCQASFNNPLMAQQHYVGKRHRKQMKKRKLMETYGPSTSPASTLRGYPCTICKLELNSVEQYQSHISGAKHKNQVKKSGVKTSDDGEKAEEQPLNSDHDQTHQYAADDGYYGNEEQQHYGPEDTEYCEEDYQ